MDASVSTANTKIPAVGASIKALKNKRHSWKRNLSKHKLIAVAQKLL